MTVKILYYILREGVQKKKLMEFPSRGMIHYYILFNPICIENITFNNGLVHGLLCMDYGHLVCVADGGDHLDRHGDPREVHPLQPDTPGQSVELLPVVHCSSCLVCKYYVLNTKH